MAPPSCFPYSGLSNSCSDCGTARSLSAKVGFVIIDAHIPIIHGKCPVLRIQFEFRRDRFKQPGMIFDEKVFIQRAEKGRYYPLRKSTSAWENPWSGWHDSSIAQHHQKGGIPTEHCVLLQISPPGRKNGEGIVGHDGQRRSFWSGRLTGSHGRSTTRHTRKSGFEMVSYFFLSIYQEWTHNRIPLDKVTNASDSASHWIFRGCVQGKGSR